MCLSTSCQNTYQRPFFYKVDSVWCEACIVNLPLHLKDKELSHQHPESIQATHTRLTTKFTPHSTNDNLLMTNYSQRCFLGVALSCSFITQSCSDLAAKGLANYTEWLQVYRIHLNKHPNSSKQPPRMVKLNGHPASNKRLRRKSFESQSPKLNKRPVRLIKKKNRKQLIRRCIARTTLLTHGNVAYWLTKMPCNIEQMRDHTVWPLVEKT